MLWVRVVCWGQLPHNLVTLTAEMPLVTQPACALSGTVGAGGVVGGLCWGHCPANFATLSAGLPVHSPVLL